jgi:hypothetical protein
MINSLIGCWYPGAHLRLSSYLNVDSALSPGAPAGHHANSAITGKPRTATNWMCLVRTLFSAPHSESLITHKFS